LANHHSARILESEIARCALHELALPPRSAPQIRLLPPHYARRYAANFVSRNFESSGPDREAGENYQKKQRLGDFDVRNLCVHILQHPAEKACDKES
jgi:hypothetical protein